MEIVQAIIVMAHTLHLQVVTEGVETLEQQRFLERYGCDYLQGYLLSRPVPLQDLHRVLDELDQRQERLNPALSDPGTGGSGSPDPAPGSPALHAGASTVQLIR